MIAVPTKRFDRAIVSYLTEDEVDGLLAAPDRTRWIGRRDHALLTLAIQTGLRVTELTNLRCQDAHLGTGPHVETCGKGRKHRATPLTKQTVAVLRYGCKSATATPTSRCSRPAAAARSAATRSRSWSPSTPPPPAAAARR